MMISGPSGVYKILGLPKDEFPEVPQSIEGAEVKIEGELLQRMIEKTVFAVSTDETRPALNGVLWQIKNNETKMVATDGHRMAKIVRRKVKISEPDKDIIIPAKALHALSRFRNEMKDLSSVTIGENHILFDLKHTLIFSRLIAETYPNYERVIPQDNTNKLTVNKSLLSSSVRRVSILSNAITHQIRLSLKENAIALSALDQDIGGEAKEEISAAYDGEPMDVGYNAMYMLEILTQMESEDVVFELKTPTTAGLVHPTEQKENEDYLCLIMPLRLNN
jgi:DNA polymerase-3 subunit beta